MRGARARLEWNGDKISANMARAASKGINRIMAECVADAKSGHLGYPPASEPYEDFHNRTAELMNSIRIFQFVPEKPGVGFVSGSWGSDMEYALFVEIGTSFIGPTAEDRVMTAHGDAKEIPPPTEGAVRMAARHTRFAAMREGIPIGRDEGFMRPAADKHYPNLAAVVRAEFEKLSAANPSLGTEFRGLQWDYIGPFAL